MSIATTIETLLRRVRPAVAAGALPRVEWRVGCDPGVVVAKAGEPVSIVFHRVGPNATSECVCFPDLGILASLPAYGETIVEIGTPAPGRYRFCAPDEDDLEGWLVVEG